MIAANGLDALEILRFAAAAERRFHHPIALAILQKAEEEGLRLPLTDATQYKVGYGITVGIDGHRVRVGKARDFCDRANSLLYARDRRHKERSQCALLIF
jgi:cation transport ATPase